MCGIAGIMHFDQQRSVDLNSLKRATNVISYRGPDGDGFCVAENVGLGHRRLSIIDIQDGVQPMFNTEKNIAIVFNGEIYNYVELREELKKLGYKFKTSSDTEVVIKAYEEWGVGCQLRFNGMWALALWDSRTKLLFVSRDRIGEKPIHYSVWDNSFVFGSEMKSIFELGVPRVVAHEFTELYLVLTNIPAPHTYFKGIKKLLPGHYLTVSNGVVKEAKYWDMPEIDENEMMSNKNEIHEQFEFLLKDSIKIRMRSDVPFGSFLSGGLDSSAIVFLMAELSKTPVHTFTIGFPQKNYDESELARIVAKKYNTIHHESTIDPNSFEEILNKLAFHFDEPFGDASSIPTFYVSKFAREKVKMVLTGDGGDEVLSGYTAYQGVKISSLYSKLPSIVQRVLPATLDCASPLFKGPLRYKLNKASRFLKSSKSPFNENYLTKKSFTDYATIQEITKEMNCISTEEYLSDFMDKCCYKDNFYKLMYLHHKHDLPNDYLVKVDRMSMANSIEARAPFLDYRLIEFMAKVDKKVKMRGMERKSVLRNTIGKRLPNEILKAPKRGFTIPLTEWFKEKNFAALQNDLCCTDWGLNNHIIKKLIGENRHGVTDNGTMIWSLMFLKRIYELNKK